MDFKIGGTLGKSYAFMFDLKKLTNNHSCLFKMQQLMIHVHKLSKRYS